MDPNAALANLREGVKELADYQAGHFPRPNLDDAIEKVTEHIEALDEWLRSGGFLPDDWSVTVPDRHLLITGNPVDGFKHTGPFRSYEVAQNAGDDAGSDWWVVPLAEPELKHLKED